MWRSVTKFGIHEFGIPNSKTQKKISMIKINELKPNKKQRIKKTKLINKVYKSTFNSINSVVLS